MEDVLPNLRAELRTARQALVAVMAEKRQVMDPPRTDDEKAELNIRQNNLRTEMEEISNNIKALMDAAYALDEYEHEPPAAQHAPPHIEPQPPMVEPPLLPADAGIVQEPPSPNDHEAPAAHLFQQPPPHADAAIAQPKNNTTKGIPSGLPCFREAQGKDRPVYNDIDKFFRSFYNNLVANQIPIETNWERLFLISFREDNLDWLEAEIIGRGIPWANARLLVIRHFRQPGLAEQLYTELISMTMRNNETCGEFGDRFYALLQRTGQKDSLTHAMIFLSKLPTDIANWVRSQRLTHLSVYPQDVNFLATVLAVRDFAAQLSITNKPTSDQRHSDRRSNHPGRQSKCHKMYGKFSRPVGNLDRSEISTYHFSSGPRAVEKQRNCEQPTKWSKQQPTKRQLPSQPKRHRAATQDP